MIQLCLLAIVSFVDGYRYEYVLASDNACFYAQTGESSTNFSAPVNGTLSGVQLIYNSNSAGLFCGKEDKDYSASNWGCNPPPDRHNNRSYTFLLKIIDQSQ